MPIRSFELVSIDAKRFTKLGERIPQLRVDQNTAVTNIAALSEKDAQLDFRFTISYVGVGMIKIEGRIVWDGEPKTIVSQWSQNGKIPNEVFGPIYGAIFTNCMPLSVVAARDLGLPPPIPPPPMPGAKAPALASTRDKRGSMEVA
ncbi:MAG TPA: hypothetical protein VGB78_06980 [Thermoplasmata archaeon]|jgi:hypothetical protein